MVHIIPDILFVRNRTGQEFIYQPLCPVYRKRQLNEPCLRPYKTAWGIFTSQPKGGSALKGTTEETKRRKPNSNTVQTKKRKYKSDYFWLQISNLCLLCSVLRKKKTNNLGIKVLLLGLKMAMEQFHQREITKQTFGRKKCQTNKQKKAPQSNKQTNGGK